MFGIGIVACQEECTIDVCSFSFSVVCANNHQVERITDSREIVFLQLLVSYDHRINGQTCLEPIDTSSTRLIG